MAQAPPWAKSFCFLSSPAPQGNVNGSPQHPQKQEKEGVEGEFPLSMLQDWHLAEETPQNTF